MYKNLTQISIALLCFWGILWQEQAYANDTPLIYCLDTMPKTLNPQHSVLSSDYEVSRLFYDRLFSIDPKTGEAQGELVESWKSTDFKTFHLKLKDKVAFHTTEYFKPSRYLNAEDVLFSFQRQWLSTHPYFVVGGPEYPGFERTSMKEKIFSIEKKGPLEVVFKLKNPDRDFLKKLALDFAVIHSAEYASFLLSKGTTTEFERLPIGTGPYQLTSYKKDVLELEKNPAWAFGKTLWPRMVLMSLYRLGPTAQQCSLKRNAYFSSQTTTKIYSSQPLFEDVLLRKAFPPSLGTWSSQLPQTAWNLHPLGGLSFISQTIQ